MVVSNGIRGIPLKTVREIIIKRIDKESGSNDRFMTLTPSYSGGSSLKNVSETSHACGSGL